MRIEQIGLFFHLIGVFLFVSGSFSIYFLRLYSITLTKPSQISTILMVCRYLVPVVAIGLILTISFGLWLTHMENYWKKSWIIGTYVLVGYMLIIGGYAGGKDKKTRILAGTQVDNDIADELLIKSLRDPFNNTLNTSMIVAIILVVALMVFKPGH